MIGIIQINCAKIVSAAEFSAFFKSVLPNAFPLSMAKAPKIHEFVDPGLLAKTVGASYGPKNSIVVATPIADSVFDLVVEMQQNGNLRSAIEEIVGAFLRQGKLSGRKFTISVELATVKDKTRYVEGVFWSPVAGPFKGLLDQTVLLAVALILIVLSPLLFPSYFDESLAVAVGVAISLLLRAFLGFRRMNGRIIEWRVV